MKTALAAVYDEVMSRYYGCGLAIPTELEGLRVLDLGAVPGATSTPVFAAVEEDASASGGGGCC